jgi:MFS family permease
VLVGFGVGAAFVAVTTAANAGVGEDRAGLAAGLLNTSLQLGGALGLAILSAVATTRTHALLQAGGVSQAEAVTEGFRRALEVGAGFAFAAGLVALLGAGKRQATPAEEEPALELAA